MAALSCRLWLGARKIVFFRPRARADAPIAEIFGRRRCASRALSRGWRFANAKEPPTADPNERAGGGGLAHARGKPAELGGATCRPRGDGMARAARGRLGARAARRDGRSICGAARRLRPPRRDEHFIAARRGRVSGLARSAVLWRALNAAPRCSRWMKASRWSCLVTATSEPASSGFQLRCARTKRGEVDTTGQICPVVMSCPGDGADFAGCGWCYLASSWWLAGWLLQDRSEIDHPRSDTARA